MSIIALSSQPSAMPFFRPLTFSIVCMALTLVSTHAVAAGFFLPTRGVDTTARGGASIAPHQADPDALWHNPAGLTQLDDRHLLLDLGVVHLSATHQRAPREMDDGSTRTYDPVDNDAPPQGIPQLLVGGPTSHPDIHWGAGFYTPWAAGSRYPVDGPQRYVVVDNTGSALGYLHGAVAWQVSDSLSFGAGLQNFMGQFQIVSVGSGYAGPFGDPEDEDLDILAEATISSYFNPTANLGVSYRAADSLQLGASLQLPHLFRDSSATLDTRLPDHPAYDNAETSGDEVSISIPFPFYLRGGLRYFNDRFDLEAALVYQHWSILDEVTLTPDDIEISGVPGVGSIPVEPFIVPQEMRNTLSAHLGGQLQATSSLSLSAGYVLERGAVPDQRFSVFALDPTKQQLTVGAAFDFDGLILSTMAGAIFMPDREITDSEVRQINPSDPDDEQSLVVANGTYEQTILLGGLSLQYLF